MYKDKVEVTARPKEVIRITNRAAEAIATQAIEYGGKEGENQEEKEFRMILGLLGGKLSDEHIFIKDAYLLALGDKTSVDPNREDSAKKYINFYKKIRAERCFLTGWYLSLPNTGIFFNRTNYETQKRYQQLFSRSVAIIIYPESYTSVPFWELMKVYRLKEDLSEKWIELDFEIIE
ncbi:MAG: hypothetical protein ACFFFY_07785 [Promethearchaeota archaeon]